MLILPIKKEWFDTIRSGEKKEEYREIKPYWTSRFKKILPLEPSFIPYYHNTPIKIKFRNGYGNNRPTILCKIRLKRGQGKLEWGAEKRKRVLYFRDFGGNKMNVDTGELIRTTEERLKELRENGFEPVPEHLKEHANKELGNKESIYVMPKELYEQVKQDIPDHVGVYCENNTDQYCRVPLRSVKKALKQELKADKEILKNSFIRSLYRTASEKMRERED